MRLSNPRVACALLLLLSGVLLGPGRGPCAGVRIVSPPRDAVLLAPDVDVQLLLDPPLLPGERVHVDLQAGLDAPAGPRDRDLSADVRIAPHARLGTLRVRDLPPGRSTLRIQRGLPGRGLLRHDPAPGSPARGPERPAVMQLLDRGGFFPEAAGPFAVGVRSAVVPRVLPDGTVRSLDVFLWFPTRDTRAPDPALLGVPGADVAPDAAALPTLVFSHGNCGRPTNYAILLSSLARAGWLVAAPTHPGNTADDPDCASFAAQLQSFVERPNDLVATVDWLLTENDDPASPFADAVDPQRIALGGHSFGALAVLRTVPILPRARAALLLAPVFAPVAPLVAPSLPLAVPVMLQVGENDATTPPASDALPLYDALAAPRFLALLTDAGHPAFEDSCAAPVPGTCPADGPEEIARLALGFLGRYAADDLRWQALLAPAPGAALTADP